MKKSTAAVLVALLILMAMCLNACAGKPAGGETSSATDTAGESATERASETATGTSVPSESESATREESGTETGTESGTESATETEPDPVPPEEAACYTLEYVTNDRGRIREKKTYFRTVREAVGANPDGADIWLCRAASEEDKGVTFPESGDFALHTVQFDYNFADYYPTGAVYEITEHYFTERAYFTSLEALLAYFSDPVLAGYRMPLADHSVWLFSAEDGYEAGKYFVSVNTEGGFDFERECGTEYWYHTAFFSVDTHVFYTIAHLNEYLEAHPDVMTIHLLGDFRSEEPIELPYGLSYRLAYDGNRMDAAFAWGVTFDDGNNGLCYYSEPSALFYNPAVVAKDKNGNIISCIWVWTEEEGYLPGKYQIVEGLDRAEATDPETGNYIVFHVERMNLTFVWVDTLDAYAGQYLK